MRVEIGKKAGERVLSIWWFGCVILISVSIIIGVILFYSYSFDVRYKEADILANEVVGCLVKDGFAIEVSNFDKDKLLEACKLNKKILDSEIYYLRISFSGAIEKKIEVGNPLYKEICGLNGENYPKCREKKIYSLDKNNQGIEIRIVAGSNNLGSKL